MANNKPLVKTHKFHLVVAQGVEPRADFVSGTIDVDHGCLVVRNANHDVVMTYAPGQWVYCERDRLDE